MNFEDNNKAHQREAARKLVMAIGKISSGKPTGLTQPRSSLRTTDKGGKLLVIGFFNMMKTS